MATRKHGETEAAGAAAGVQGRLEDAFEWVNANARLVLSVLGAAFVLGAVVAGGYEWSRRSELAAHAQLAEVEREFLAAMGSSPEATFVTEPANADQARQAREQAIASFERVVAEHGGSVAARSATIRAAEAEIDLGRLEAAEARLTAAIGDWQAEHALTGVAERLRGYVLEEQGRFDEAAAAYEAAARTDGYPARASVWLAAAESWASAGELDRAIVAFQEVITADTAFAERNRVRERLDDLQALSPVASAP